MEPENDTPATPEIQAETPLVTEIVEAENAVDPVADMPETVAETKPDHLTPEPGLLQAFDAEQKAEETPVDDKAEVVEEKDAEPEKTEEKSEEVEAKPEDKAEEKKEEGEPPVEEEGKEPDPEPIEYEDFELPENFQSNAELIGDLKTLLGEHRLPQETGQKLVDLHTKAMNDFAKAYQEETTRNQWNTWVETRHEWRRQSMADEEIGGNGFQTALSKIANVRDRLVAPEEREDFTNFLTITGVDDHPWMLKLLYRMDRFINEAIQPPPEPKIPTGHGTKPVTRLRQLYKNEQ